MEKAWITDNAFTTTIIGNGYEEDFLVFLLKYSQLRKYSNSTAQPVISGKTIYPILVPLPPLPEQHRIVAEIERWFSLIDTIESGKASLQTAVKQAKSKILDLAIHGRLVPQCPDDEPASQLLRRINPKAEICSDNVPFEVPDGWVWTTLGEIGDIVTGSTPSKDISEYYGGDIPFFKPADLDQGIETSTSIDHLTERGYEQSRKLPAKSVLVTCIGATIGKTGLITTDGTCNQQINAIIPSHAVLSSLLYFVCISVYFQHEMKVKASATTLPILNKKNFTHISIPLPPLAEQHRIVSKIEELFAQLDRIEAEL